MACLKCSISPVRSQGSRVYVYCGWKTLPKAWDLVLLRRKDLQNGCRNGKVAGPVVPLRDLYIAFKELPLILRSFIQEEAKEEALPTSFYIVNSNLMPRPD